MASIPTTWWTWTTSSPDKYPEAIMVKFSKPLSEAAWRRMMRERAATALAASGIALAEGDEDRIEVADLGLDDFARQGLCILVYVNNDRYCAKELVLGPGQTCPEHLHPPFGGGQGKTETFRCRSGVAWLRVEGPPTTSPEAVPPAGHEAHYTATMEVMLLPGQQHTIPPNTRHWFQAGPLGAVISEFSSQSRDDLDVFTDPNVRRVGGARKRRLPAPT
jgi:D-lyxose ketol-isomerase